MEQSPSLLSTAISVYGRFPWGRLPMQCSAPACNHLPSQRPYRFRKLETESYFVGRTGLTDVYVRDLLSGREINITNNQNRERGAVISADGMNVAYETRSRGNSEIRVYSFESGQSRLLCQSWRHPE